jgi:hypothetical protein
MKNILKKVNKGIKEIVKTGLEAEKVMSTPNKNIEGWELPKVFKFVADEFPNFKEDLYNYLQAQRESICKEIEGLKNPNPQSIIGETYSEAIDDVINLINSSK